MKNPTWYKERHRRMSAFYYWKRKLSSKVDSLNETDSPQIQAKVTKSPANLASLSPRTPDFAPSLNVSYLQNEVVPERAADAAILHRDGRTVAVTIFTIADRPHIGPQSCSVLVPRRQHLCVNVYVRLRRDSRVGKQTRV